MLRGAVLFHLWVMFAAASTAGRTGSAPTPAVPVEPIAAILRAFESHALVALADDPHGSEQLHAFRVSLVRDPRFARVVDDIVVEFGNARYQDVMDRFVRGDDVPLDVLQKVWQNTTQATDVWDRAIYAEFFREVRDVNSRLPRERQLRILLGDPPVDWERGPEDAGKWTPRRTELAAQVVLDEVTAKRRHALVIYGGGHLVRTGQSIVGRVERAARTKVFTVAVLQGATLDWVLQADPTVAGWRAPSLTTLAGTLLNQQNLVYWDTALYLGMATAISPIPRSLCADSRYLAMRLERMALAGLGANRTFRAECALPR